MANVEIDNKKMWESILVQTKFNTNLYRLHSVIVKALNKQGLEYKDGEIISNAPVQETSDVELTEFEKWFKKLIGCYASAMGTPIVEQPEYKRNEFVKNHASSLLSIARKQIASEINVSVLSNNKGYMDGIAYSPTDMYQAYLQGIEDTVKAIKSL